MEWTISVETVLVDYEIKKEWNDVCSYWSRNWLVLIEVKNHWDPWMTDILMFIHTLQVQDLYIWSGFLNADILNDLLKNPCLGTSLRRKKLQTTVQPSVTSSRPRTYSWIWLNFNSITRLNCGIYFQYPALLVVSLFLNFGWLAEQDGLCLASCFL